MPRHILPLALLLSACHAHTGVGFGVGTPGPVPPASASVSVHAGPALGALIGLGIIAASVREDGDDPVNATPALDPQRRVHEQDCSKPIEDPAANLRCR